MILSKCSGTNLRIHRQILFSKGAIDLICQLAKTRLFLAHRWSGYGSVNRYCGTTYSLCVGGGNPDTRQHDAVPVVVLLCNDYYSIVYQVGWHV